MITDRLPRRLRLVLASAWPPVRNRRIFGEVPLEAGRIIDLLNANEAAKGDRLGSVHAIPVEQRRGPGEVFLYLLPDGALADDDALTVFVD